MERIRFHKETDEIAHEYLRTGVVPENVDLEYVERVISFLNECIARDKQRSNSLPELNSNRRSSTDYSGP